jgi:hypothetical protein
VRDRFDKILFLFLSFFDPKMGRATVECAPAALSPRLAVREGRSLTKEAPMSQDMAYISTPRQRAMSHKTEAHPTATMRIRGGGIKNKLGRVMDTGGRASNSYSVYHGLLIDSLDEH